jgi:hypothetical protein
LYFSREQKENRSITKALIFFRHSNPVIAGGSKQIINVSNIACRGGSFSFFFMFSKYLISTFERWQQQTVRARYARQICNGGREQGTRELHLLPMISAPKRRAGLLCGVSVCLPTEQLSLLLSPSLSNINIRT